MPTTHVRVGPQSVEHRRAFTASIADVRRALTTAELLARWTGPRGSRLRIDRLDAVTGGAFDWTVEVGDERFRFRGSYHEVTPSRIVHTWQQDGDDDVTLEVLELSEPAPGLAELVVISTFVSEEACRRMLDSGLDAGMDSDHDRLEELLAALA